jgi:flagellar hook-associated protein 3 FlgL
MNIRMMSAAVQRHQMTAHEIQQQIASGKKVVKGSDDPAAFDLIRKLAADQKLMAQYERNGDMASHYLAQASQGLSEAVNLMHRIGELAVQGGDGTFDQVAREALADEADALLQSLLAVANGSEGGRYNFGGLRTDTPPYEVVRDPVTDRISAVEYRGSEETRTIKTGEELYVSTNLAGSTAVGEGGLFQTETRDVFDSIIQLRDALLDGENIAEGTMHERVEDDLTHLLSKLSINGAREEQVRVHKIYNQDKQASNLKSIDELESIDVAAAFMRLSESETAYQAALHGTSRMMQQVSLLNHM